MNRRVTVTEFKMDFEALSDEARHDPVTIVQPGQADLVVLALSELERLKKRDRRVGLTEDLPEHWVDAIRVAKVPDEFSCLDDMLG